MTKRLWILCVLAAVLPSVAHAQHCAGQRPNDICETAPGPGLAGETAAAAAVGKPVGADAKVSAPIRAVLSSLQQQTLGVEGQQFVARYSTDLVRLNAAGEVHVYVELIEFRPEYVPQLEAYGLRVEVSLPEFRIVQGWLLVGAVDAVAGLDFVKEVRQPDYGMKNAVGAAATQGDALLRADVARGTFGITGAGVKVGVISDGVQFLAASQASGDLPATVQVLKTGSGNEGTAMLEIVHDLAPGSALAFWGPATSVEMVQGINALRNAGARVIVDDLAFLGEPKFQDGMIAQAIRSFAQAGGVYAGSAGNQAKQHYRAAYLREPTTGGSSYEGVHNYLPGSVDIGNSLVVPNGCSLTVFLQWNNPQGSASDDFDLVIARASDGSLLAFSLALQDGSQNPFEATTWQNTTGATTTVYIAVLEWQLRTGTPITLDYFAFHSCASGAQDFLQYATAAQSLTGNHGLNEMLAVAALGAETPDVAQVYSSIGPHDVHFPAFESRAVPNISAIDCVQTRTGQLGHFSNPFCGTSAAAPHAAAIAALLLEASPGLSSQQVRDILMGTAVDLGPGGFDLVYGAGRIDALQAVSASVPAFAEILSTGTAFGAGQTVVLTVRANNPPGGQPLDLYVGALWPDGNTIAFLAGPEAFGGLGQYSAPASVAPMMVLPGGTPLITAVLHYTFPASGIPVGTYHVFASLFRQGSLADNALNDGDLVSLDYFGLAYSP